MATKIKQRPKVTKQGPKVKPRAIGGGKKGVEHVHGLARQEKKNAKAGGGHGAVQLPKGVEVREYPGEGKGRSFGGGVKIVGKTG